MQEEISYSKLRFVRFPSSFGSGPENGLNPRLLLKKKNER
jgi:hypothetical protein